MKPFSKTANKWILSTLMIAALGSQYYFSVSSNSVGQFELSSTTAEEFAEKESASPAKTPAKADAKSIRESDPTFMGPPTPAGLKKTQAPETIVIKAAKTQALAAATAPASTATATTVAPKHEETEGRTVVVDCKGCSQVEKDKVAKAILDVLQIPEIALANASKSETTPAPEVKSQPTVAKVDEHADETPAERSRRLREERREAKEEKRLAKEEAEREKREERNEAFADKASEIAERCSDDLSCKMSRFTSLMRSYTGRKKVDQFAVTKAYNELIAGDLKGALNGTEGSASKTAALEALSTMMSSVPSDYKFLKKNSIDSVKYGQIAQAASVETLYKQVETLNRQADAFKAQNRINEEIATRDQALNISNQAQSADQTFRQDANAVYSTLGESLGSVNDTTTWNYVTASYVPDLQNAINRFTGITGFSVGSTTVSSSLNGNGSGTVTSAGRNSRNGNATNINNGAAITNGSNNLNKVQFGKESGNPSVNRTGISFK